MDAGRGPPGGRLDLSHGFVRHIRRNQIARDDYDRQVKQAKEQLRRRLTPAPARPRRPDQQVYRAGRRSAAGAPPGGGGGESEASSESSSSSRERRPRGPALFCLEYEADGGQVTSVVVHQLSGQCATCKSTDTMDRREYLQLRWNRGFRESQIKAGLWWYNCGAALEHSSSVIKWNSWGSACPG